MIEIHGGIDLRICKRIINSLYSNIDANVQEIRSNLKKDFPNLSPVLFYSYLRFLRSSGFIKVKNRGYCSLTFDGILFKKFSDHKSLELTNIEKFIILNNLIRDNFFSSAIKKIIIKFVEDEKKYGYRELAQVVLECYKDFLLRNKNEKSLKELEKIKKYEDEFNSLTPNEKINSKYWYKLRHLGGGTIEILYKLDILSREQKGRYFLNPRIFYPKVKKLDDFYEIFIQLYSSFNFIDEYSAKKKILMLADELREYLPISISDFKKAALYRIIKDGQAIKISELENIINKLLLTQSLLFKKMYNKIFITGVNDF